MAASIPLKQGLCLFSFEEGDELNLREIVDYLFYLRVIYFFGMELFGHDPVEVMVENQDYFINKFKRVIATIEPGEEYDIYSKQIDFEPVIKKIHYGSPLEIFIYGLVSALTIAAILSGGKVNLKAPGFAAEFKLKPIGEGLIKLSEFFKKRRG